MRVLGLDTSGYRNAIGVVDGNCTLADCSFEARTDSLEKIVSHIDATLKDANLKLEDIEGFGVGLGPGSWTGIRVGVTVGKTLAFSTGKPVCGIPTLDALAYGIKESASHICSLIYGGTKDMVYAGFYSIGKGSLVKDSDYYVGDLSGLKQMLPEQSVIAAVGNPDFILMIKQSFRKVDIRQMFPSGAVVAAMAERRLSRGEHDDTLALTPLYLKESTARVFAGKYSGRKG